MSGLGDDHAFAADLAFTTGQVLLDHRREHLAAGVLTGRELANVGDGAGQEHIAARLLAERPSDAVLSEEATDDAVRLGCDRVWIVDPLDGTREYSENRHDWAVHIALWRGDSLVAGAVALPSVGETLCTVPASVVPSAPASRIRFAVSRSRASELVRAVAERVGAELVPMGSAGYKACAVVRGDVDAYLHSGGQYEWDSAAPVAVAEAAGLHTSRTDGSTLRYNQANPYLPDLLVCRAELSLDILSAIAEVSGIEGTAVGSRC